MTIKTIYVHPDDLLEIRIVFDKELPKSKAEWQAQRSNQMNALLISVRDSRTIGFSDFGYSFRLENADGTIKRWLE